MYHSLCAGKRDRKNPLYEIQTSSKKFDKHMEYICKHYNVIPLDKAIECLYGGGELPKNSIVVTFDDGFKDNYTIGLPILKKYNVPAIIFLTTSLVSSTVPYWQQKLKAAIELTNPHSIKKAIIKMKVLFSQGQVEELLKAIDNGDKEELTTKLFAFIEKKEEKNAGEKFIDNLLKELDLYSAFRLPDAQMMSWDDARDMLSYGISFGSHTMTHPILSNIPLVFAEKEIKGSKKEIEKRLNIEVKHFAYPNGLHMDFTEEHKDILKRSGYKSGIAVCWGYNNSNSDRYSMRRIPIGDYALPKFIMRIKGVNYKSYNECTAVDVRR